MSPRLSLAFMIALCAVVPAAGAESFKAWAARGAREERERDPKAALASYSTALSLWKDGDGPAGKAKVLCARSLLREKDGDAAGALDDLSACLELDKRNAKGFHRRGLMRMKAGMTSRAISDFYRAVALDIGFAQAYADRARAYESQGEIDFAREDYRHACRLGVKAACARAKALGPKTAKVRKPAPEAPPEPEEPPAAAPAVEEAEEEPAAPTEKAAPPPANPPAPKPSYRPKYRDCLAALEVCVERGDSFGACVRAAPNCDKKPVKGCCPAACLKAYQKASDRSEAEAYREHFAPGSACGAPPKEEEAD